MEMLKDKNAKDINFQGIAVGDGWTGCVPKDGQPVNWCIDLDNVVYSSIRMFIPGHGTMSNFFMDIRSFQMNSTTE